MSEDDSDLLTGAERARILRVLFEEQDRKCYYCECECWLGNEQEIVELCDRYKMAGLMESRKRLRHMRASVEHLRRKVDGGTDDPRNLAMACEFCNGTRADRPVSDHFDHVAWMIRNNRHPCRDTTPLPAIPPTSKSEAAS